MRAATDTDGLGDSYAREKLLKSRSVCHLCAASLVVGWSVVFLHGMDFVRAAQGPDATEIGIALFDDVFRSKGLH